MKKRLYNIFIFMLLCSSSIFLTSCEAITAQNITITDFNKGMNNNPGMMEMRKQDIIGKVISISLNSITIEIIEQNENDNSFNSDDKKNDDNNQQAQIGLPGDTLQDNYTGIEKTLAVSEDVEISQETRVNFKNKNEHSKSSLKVLDLKKGQVVMIWYKEDTEIVERISVI